MAKQDHLKLPPLVFGPITHPVGRYFHVVRPEIVEKVIEKSEAPISARLTAPMYTLSNGERIIVTARPQIKQRPPEADGVIRTDPNGNSTWLWHKSLEQFAVRIEKSSCAAV